MQKETQWRLLMLIRLYHIDKIEFLTPLPLNLNVFHIIIADQRHILLFLVVLFLAVVPCHASLSKLLTNINI